MLTYTLDFLLWCPPKNRPPVMSPTLSHSISLWDTMRNLPSLISEIHPLAHIFHNPQFSPGMDIKAFQWWLDKGMYRIGHYFCTGPLSFQHCKHKLDLPDSEKFKYHQIFNYLSSLWKNKPNSPYLMDYERWCCQKTGQRGGISLIYLSFARDTTKFPYMEAWEKDLQDSWDLDAGHKSFSRSFKRYN